MTSTDDEALTVLAADFPAWHVWRSRDGRGRDAGWNANRRAKPGRGALAAGVLGKGAAHGPGELRSQLEQQRALEAGEARAA
jgi:hypothetical protein